MGLRAMDELSPTKRADLIGGPTLPSIAAALYGIYLVFRGAGDGSVHPYVLIAGGLLSVICVSAYVTAVFAPPGRSWGMTFASLSAFIPYMFSLYLMGYHGVWALWTAATRYGGVGPIILGAIWLLAGWRLLYTLDRIRRPS